MSYSRKLVTAFLNKLAEEPAREGQAGTPGMVYSTRFYHLGVSGLKMALYRDLAKDDPKSPGYQ
jgi:hypothetical protein